MLSQIGSEGCAAFNILGYITAQDETRNKENSQKAASREAVMDAHAFEWLQAPAQAQNIRDSLEEAGVKGIKVSIALRKGSPSWEEAEACGFSTVDGTLGEVFDMITKSDFVILLISDGAQVLLSP